MLAWRIDHIGSIAIEGMEAKLIIDIQICVEVVKRQLKD
ncbi:GrpB family protein [Aureibacillus halotolerans]|nr:GrpB family protein [Aureibacillus halotolerans]